MTSNFNVLKQQKFGGRLEAKNAAGQEGQAARPTLYAKPPKPAAAGIPVASYGAVRAADGRTARRTGRTVQFGTLVSPQFKLWMKTQAKALGKTQAALLDDMRATYIEKFGE